MNGLTPPNKDGLYIGVDPGKTSGVAWMYVKDGQLEHHRKAEYGFDMMFELILGLNAMNPVKYIVEDFTLFQHLAQAQTGSKFETVEVKGACRLAAKMGGVPIVFQSPTFKDTGNIWSQIWSGTGHMPNPISAYNHAFYYLVKNEIIPHPVLLNDERDWSMF